MSEGKILQIERIVANPKACHEFIQMAPMQAKAITKMGGKLLGMYQALFGSAFEVMLLIEYDSLQDRLDGLNEFRADPEVQKAFAAVGPELKSIDVAFTRPLPLHPISHPAKDSKIALRTYMISGPMGSAIKDFKPVLDVLVEYGEKSGFKINGVYVNMFSNHSHAFQIIFEIPAGKSVDYFSAIPSEIAKSGQHTQIMENFYKHVNDAGFVVFAPAWINENRSDKF